MKRFLIIFTVEHVAEAANEELARAAAALEFGLDELPEDTVVQELAA